MKKITALTIVFLGLGILACAGGTDETTDDDVKTEETKDDAKETKDAKGAKLNQLWKDMNLPVGSGEVLVDSAEMLLIGWEGGSITTTTQNFKTALGDAGWAVEEELVSGSQGEIHTAIIYKKDSVQVGLATGEDSGVTFVYMEDLGKVSDDDSAIKNPDRRGKIGSDVRSRRGGKAGKGGSGSKGGKGGSGKKGKGSR